MEASDTSKIDWNDVIKKEARGSGNEDLGEVQEVDRDYVLVQRGILNKEKFYIPRELAESYDGNVLRFKISEDDAKNRFLTHSPPKSSTDETLVPRRNDESMSKRAEDDKTRVPITEEKLDVQKTTSVLEATIVKEPVTKTKTFEVPLSHEEISVERRPVSSNNNNTTTTERPVEFKTEIKFPLKKEEVEVKKQPYVKEEVAVRKKPVAETRKLREKITSEKVNSSESTGPDIREEEL
jgi:uncharacterized protein (TIGR02271 family)